MIPICLFSNGWFGGFGVGITWRMIDPSASSGLVSWIPLVFLGGTPASLLDLLLGPSFNHFRVKSPIYYALPYTTTVLQSTLTFPCTVVYKHSFIKLVQIL